MRVIGTAGHVDHGKSTLIEALTGTHPDRLKEEREREMTIDLGFAWIVPKEQMEESITGTDYAYEVTDIGLIGFTSSLSFGIKF